MLFIGKPMGRSMMISAPLPALPMPGAGCCEQYHTTVSQLENFQFSVNLKTFSGKRDVRASSFELETAIENVTPSGIGCTFLDPLSIIKVLS